MNCDNHSRYNTYSYHSFPKDDKLYVNRNTNKLFEQF